MDAGTTTYADVDAGTTTHADVDAGTTHADVDVASCADAYAEDEMAHL